MFNHSNKSKSAQINAMKFRNVPQLNQMITLRISAKIIAVIDESATNLFYRYWPKNPLSLQLQVTYRYDIIAQIAFHFTAMIQFEKTYAMFFILRLLVGDSPSHPVFKFSVVKLAFLQLQLSLSKLQTDSLKDRMGRQVQMKMLHFD